MALVDFKYRLKPQSGDTTAHDELAVGANLSGGTITLVDLGAGEYAWHILGGASAVVASKTMNPAIAGGGYTFAIRVAITTWPATYADFAGLSEAKLQNASGTTVRAKVYNVGGYSTTGATASMGTTFHTYVLKYVTAAAMAADGVVVWVNKVGRSGVTPDLSNLGANANSVTINTVSIGSSGTVVDVTDFVVWGEELSDADCAALADTGIRATLDGAGDQTLTPDLFTNSNTFYSPTVTYDQTLTPGLFTNTNAFYSATVSLSGGAQNLTPGLFSNANAFHAATVARVPGFLTPVLKNNTGTVLASETGVACNVYNASTGALVVRKTGLTSSAAGIVSVTDAAMAAGTTYSYEIVLTGARRLPVAAA